MKRPDPKVYADMSPEQVFVVLASAVSRRDWSEAERITDVIPRFSYEGLHPSIIASFEEARSLAQVAVFFLQEVLSAARGMRLAADCLCLSMGLVPFGIGEDELAVQTALAASAAGPGS